MSRTLKGKWHEDIALNAVLKSFLVPHTQNAPV